MRVKDIMSTPAQTPGHISAAQAMSDTQRDVPVKDVIATLADIGEPRKLEIAP